MNKRILCIDDSPIMLRNIHSILKDYYDVDLATSCKQGLFHIEKHVPDLILLDCEMPECDGKETFQIIRSLPNGKDIPIIFLTGVSDSASIMQLLNLGPAGYVLKPVAKEEVFNAINKALSRL